MGKYLYKLNTVLLIAVGFTVHAQKLPNVQEGSKLAPSDIKVDGKNLEWNDTFLAENKRLNILYTVSNDADNLYLTIKSTDATTKSKIMAGGISFSVNTQGKKKEEEAFTVTYPIIKRIAGMGGRGMRGGGRMGSLTISATGASFGMQGKGNLSSAEQDSIAAVAHKAQLAEMKEIKLNNFKNITDSLISIYNEYGIKAFASFDNKDVFFYELAIPLKLMNISADQAKALAYNIKLNGMQMNGFGGTMMAMSAGGGGNRGGGNRGGGGRGGFGGGSYGGGNVDFMSLMSPTDFWGKYILAK